MTKLQLRRRSTATVRASPPDRPADERHREGQTRTFAYDTDGTPPGPARDGFPQYPYYNGGGDVAVTANNSVRSTAYSYDAFRAPLEAVPIWS